MICHALKCMTLADYAYCKCLFTTIQRINLKK